MKHFNQFVHDKRKEKELPLRAFCKLTGLDPVTWSNIERGLAKQDLTPDMLESISKALELGEEDKQTLWDLAVLDSQPLVQVPESKIIESLPIFVRTIRGGKPSDQELTELHRQIQNSHQVV